MPDLVGVAFGQCLLLEASLNRECGPGRGNKAICIVL